MRRGLLWNHDRRANYLHNLDQHHFNFNDLLDELHFYFDHLDDQHDLYLNDFDNFNNFNNHPAPVSVTHETDRRHGLL